LKTKSDAVEHRVANFNKGRPHFNKHLCDCAALITNTFVSVIKAVDRLFLWDMCPYEKSLVAFLL